MSFERPPDYPAAVPEEADVDKLIKTNTCNVDEMLLKPPGQSLGVGLELMGTTTDPAAHAQTLANSLLVLQRLRGSQETHIYVLEDGSSEVYWEIPNTGNHHAYVTERHIRDSRDKLAFVMAEVTSQKPRRYQKLLVREQEMEYVKLRQQSFADKLRGSLAAIVKDTSIQMYPAKTAMNSLNTLARLRRAKRHR